MAESEHLLSHPLGRLLKVAVSAGIESAVRLHISRGDDLEGRDEAGLTPLLIAAARNRAPICRMLLEAGANPHASDSRGRNALSIALAHASAEAAAVINEHLARTLEPSVQAEARTEVEVALVEHATDRAPATVVDATANRVHSADVEHRRGLVDADDSQATPRRADIDAALSGRVSCEQCWDPEAIGQDHAQTVPDGVPPPELEFGDWEPVDTPEPPPDNPAVLRAEAERQRLIDAHAPIDRGASWEDFDAFLPEQARPLARADDQGFLQTLRGLLLRALREGSVPKVAIEDALSERGDGEIRDEQAEAALEFIIGDLGADVDERLEFCSPFPTENFEVTIARDESEAEESEVDAALLHFEQMRSGSNDPLRIYYRSAGTHSLLTADQEVALAKAMEVAVEQALDALADWPEGIRNLVAAIAHARVDATALGRLVATAPAVSEATDSAEEDAQSDGDINEADPEQPEGEQSLGGMELEVALEGDEVPFDDPLDVFDRIIELTVGPPSPHVSALREQLARLRFRRPFLISLADRATECSAASAHAYRRAIAELLVQRSRMAEANLRLVLDLARRQLHTGAAIEDLIQDGNLGLLSAVDKFDWRRGFRFSTMATWWVKQSLARGVADKLFAIRLPVHIRERLSRARWETEALERKRGMPVSVAEQAALCGLSLKKFETAARAFSDPLSLEQAELEGLFEPASANDPFELLAAKEQVRALDNVLAHLKRKDAEILRMRYGFGVPEAMTLEQVGQILEVTRERVRQIESKAIKKLASKPRRDTIAIALGMPVAEPESPTIDAPLVFGEDELIGDTEVAEAAQQRQRQAQTRQPGHSPEDPATAEDDVDGMQRLVETAWKLGFPVSVKGDGAEKHYVFGIFNPDNGRARNLVRCLVELGYTLRAGQGYCK